MEIKDYIVEEADKLFCQFGFKSVTMDDIAKHLGMSKKTIYQNFVDKNELVNILIKRKTTMQCCCIAENNQNARDAVEEIFFALRDIGTLLSSMNPKLFYDLQKYHPKAWITFKKFRDKTLAEAIDANLERGLNEGIYRPDLNKHIITQLRLQQVDILFNNHKHFTIDRYSLMQVMTQITTHFLYGLCNANGLVLIDKYNAEKTNL